MKCCLSWLEEWLGEPLKAEPLAETLTMAGLEVESLGPVASVSGVVAGRIRRIEPHPDADRLNLCDVDAGGGGLLRVVCGAPNAREGMCAPFAPVGARLGDVDVGRVEIRGEPSHGMLCSASELGLEERSEGLLDLGDGVAAGADLVEHLALDDTVLNLDLTPNRGDCFSVLGLAREIAAIRGGSFSAPGGDPVVPAHQRGFEVRVADRAACPRYLARVVNNVNPEAATPLWMKERLRRSGVRALHPVVDVMNYVMFELGQPLHAFDLDRLEGRVEVRRSRAGENVELIGGTCVDLNAGTLLIADARGPLALAGIMGGAASAVSEATRDILIECAFFAPGAIMGKARSYGLHTDASLRFERGVDPSLQARAMERACELLRDIAGGEFGPVTEVAAPRKPPAPIALRSDALNRLLGVEIDRGAVTGMLASLGCRVEPCEDGWHCVPPPHRFDLVIEEDLVEEVGRLYGYDRIAAPRGPAPGAVADAAMHRAPLESSRERNEEWRTRLVDRGYFEVISYSFVEPELLAAVSDAPTLALSNAVSPGASVMRASLWPGLLGALSYNLNRQRERVRIFELGQCFDTRGERPVLAGLAHGDVVPEQWGAAARAGDFYDVKGDVESLLGSGVEIAYERSARKGLHPGRAADILFGGQRVGCFGALAPAVARRLGVAREVLLFEIELGMIAPPAPARTTPLSRYPLSRRDISVTVPAGVSAGQVLACIRGAGTDLLREVVLFDVYQDEKIGKGRKSMALGLIFQDFSDTLSDEGCAGMVDDVVAALTESLDVKLRD